MSLELIYDLVEGRMLNDGRFESKGVVVGSYIKIKIIKKVLCGRQELNTAL
jgi:hypothetical protein